MTASAANDECPPNSRNRMKTFKEYISEAKQVGTLYHFTSVDRLHQMIHQDEPFNLESLNRETISTTRNPQLPVHNAQFRPCNVRIALDGDKISEHHKIKPIAGVSDDSGDVFNHKHNEKHRVKRDSGEAEEAIVKHPLNIKKYIKHIHIIKNRDTDDTVEKHIVTKLKELNIPYSHTKSYSLGSIKEDLSHGFPDWAECFEIEI